MTDQPIPPIVQAIGLACVPVHDMPPGVLARRPVAACVITLQRRDDGHRDILVRTLTETDPAAPTLPALIDEALVIGGPTIASVEDKAVLAIETMARRAWGGQALARLTSGSNGIDPCLIAATRIDEAALCRRLQISAPLVGDIDVERAWSWRWPDGVVDIALAWAAARLMLWAHVAALAAGQPDPLYETLLPLGDWAEAEPHSAALAELLRSPPMRRVVNSVDAWLAYRAARDAGDDSVRWDLPNTNL